MNHFFHVCLSVVLLVATRIAPASEIQELDTPAASGSLAPSTAQLDDDRLILTWLEPVGEGHALRFSVLDETGFGPAGMIAAGEDWFVNWADTPGLFVLPNGDWVAHWLVKSGPATYAYDVAMARSLDQGRKWSEPHSPHDDGTTTEHGFVSYYPAGSGRVGVVWLDGRSTGTGVGGSDDHDGHGQAGAMTLRTASLDGDGAIGSPALLDERVCDCCQTASVMTPEGAVVVYRGRSEDEIRDHYVVRQTAAGWTEPMRLHADNWRIGGCPVNGPAMVADGERVAVAWFTMPDDEPRVHIALSTDSGRNFSLAHTLGEGSALGRVDLARTTRGFVLSWIDQQDRSGVLVLSGYDWQGRQRWQQRIGGVDAGRASGFPRIGVVEGCRPVVVWTGKVGGERRIRVAALEVQEACAPSEDS